MSIPHFYQSNPSTCGPTCLRMICEALGRSVDEMTLAGLCNVTPFGCTIQDLIDGAIAAGMNAQLLPVSSEPQAIASLSNSAPFVAMIDLANLHGSGPMFQWHFVVPLEHVRDEVRFHDPADGPNRVAKLDDFLAAWATAGYRGVQVWTP